MKVNELTEDMKMSVENFEKEGFLQKMNHMFLHFLGLYMAVENNELVVYDARDHTKVGLFFGFDEMSEEELVDVKNKHNNVTEQLAMIAQKRKEYLKLEGIQIPMESIPGIEDINQKMSRMQNQKS